MDVTVDRIAAALDDTGFEKKQSLNARNPRAFDSRFTVRNQVHNIAGSAAKR